MKVKEVCNLKIWGSSEEMLCTSLALKVLRWIFFSQLMTGYSNEWTQSVDPPQQPVSDSDTDAVLTQQKHTTEPQD